METEALALTMMILGFAAVIVISLAVIISLWVQTKNKSYSWFLVQVVLLIAAFSMFIVLLIGNYNTSIAILSEKNFPILGIIGALWAFSMLFMLIGIYKLGKVKVNQPIGEKEEYNTRLVKVLGMLAFYSMVCPLIPFLISSIASWLIGFSKDDPLVYVFTTISSLGLLILWLRRKYILNFKSMFSMDKISAILFIPLAIITIGQSILLSEVDNFMKAIIPMSDFWIGVFNSLLGEGFPTWKGFLAVAVTAPIVEEIIMRGLILRSFLKHYSVRKSIILSALLFGLLHMNPWQFVTAFASGIIFGWWYVKTNSIVTTIFGHALNNSMGYIMSAIGVSIQGFNASGPTIHQPLWFNLLGVILLISGVVWLVKLFNKIQESREEVLVVAEGSTIE